MGGHRLSLGVVALCIGALSGWAVPAEQPQSPEHFIYFGLERDRILDPQFRAASSVAGAQLKYTWRKLEPERVRYDLRTVRADLARLEREGKKLFIQLQDVSFDQDIVNVPDYLLEDPAFGGGADLKYEFEDDDESRPVVDGWVARRWDPTVRVRFAALRDGMIC